MRSQLSSLKMSFRPSSAVTTNPKPQTPNPKEASKLDTPTPSHDTLICMTDMQPMCMTDMQPMPTPSHDTLI
jgi:hypothetical protein